LPEAELHGTSPLVGNGSMRIMNLSKLPTSPLKDKRVRQALAMLIDRDLMIEVFGNVSGFEAEGVPVETAWHSHTPASWPGIWLDPKANKLGSASKYFHHDPEEAAKLLRAASQFGVELEFGVWTDAQLPQQAETMDVVTEMVQQGGHFRLNRVFGEYRTWYVPRYSTNPGSFEGIASYQVVPSFPDWNMVMWGMAPGARNDFIFDWNLVPGLREIMLKHRDERDLDKRVSLAQDWQKLLAEEMPFIPYSMPGGTTSFEFNWPWLSNFGVIQPWGTYAIAGDTYIDYWFDQAKYTG
jgi:ABC-type transport system substrate-binding protein